MSKNTKIIIKGSLLDNGYPENLTVKIKGDESMAIFFLVEALVRCSIESNIKKKDLIDYTRKTYEEIMKGKYE